MQPNAGTVHTPARVIPIFANAEKDDTPQEFTWVQRRALDLGIKTMVQPVKPYWNTTMVTAWVAVIGLLVVLLSAIGGLYVYTKDSYMKLGDEQGYQRAQREHMEERLRIAEAEAKKAKEAALIKAGK